jgi:hypothetical protein
MPAAAATGPALLALNREGTGTRGLPAGIACAWLFSGRLVGNTWALGRDAPASLRRVRSAL